MRGRRLARWATICVFAGVAAAHHAPVSVALAQAPSDESDYRVIVHPGNPATSAEKAFLTQAFLKKVRRWPDGESIQPVDLRQDAPVRRRCSVEVMGRSVEAVKIYWQQMIFSGRELPPPEMSSDDEVVNYVLRRPGAIGYVSARANLHGAKVLAIK